MSSAELAGKLVQLVLMLVGATWSFLMYRKTHKRGFMFIGGALVSWALGMLFLVSYYALRGRTPPEPSAAHIAWMGLPIFLISLNQHLSVAPERRFSPKAANLAALGTMPLTILWVFHARGLATPLFRTLCGGFFAYLAWLSCRSLIWSKAQNHPQRAHYHALVLVVVGLCQLGLTLPLIGAQDFLRLVPDILLSVSAPALAPVLNLSRQA